MVLVLAVGLFGIDVSGLIVIGCGHKHHVEVRAWEIELQTPVAEECERREDAQQEHQVLKSRRERTPAVAAQSLNLSHLSRGYQRGGLGAP